MQISGVITEPGFKQNFEKTKEVFSFKFLKDGDEKPFNIYTSNEELQAIIMTLNKKHVTLEGSESNKGSKTYFNPASIKESEAPKQAQQQEQVVSKVIPQTRENSIETQVAIKAVIELVANGQADLDNPLMADLIQDTLSWIRARIPQTAPKTASVAPEPTVVMANKAQIFNLKKFVKSKNDADLLVQAEGRVGRDLASLEELTLDEADTWLNEVKAKK